MRPTVWFWALAGVALLSDQLTKLAARTLLDCDRPVRVIPGLFDLSLSYNSGAAFGVLPNWAPLFALAGLATVFAIVRLRVLRTGSRCLATGLGLLMGGALGNLVDRLTSATREVTDFLSFYVRVGGRVYAWPTFNLADAAIVIGAVFVIFHVYATDKKRSEPRAEPSNGI